MQLNGLKEGGVRSGPNLFKRGIHKQRHPGRASGEVRQPLLGFGQRLKAFGFGIKVDANGAGSGLRADGGIRSIPDTAYLDERVSGRIREHGF